MVIASSCSVRAVLDADVSWRESSASRRNTSTLRSARWCSWAFSTAAATRPAIARSSVTSWSVNSRGARVCRVSTPSSWSLRPTTGTVATDWNALVVQVGTCR